MKVNKKSCNDVRTNIRYKIQSSIFVMGLFVIAGCASEGGTTTTSRVEPGINAHAEGAEQPAVAFSLGSIKVWWIWDKRNITPVYQRDLIEQSRSRGRELTTRSPFVIPSGIPRQMGIEIVLNDQDLSSVTSYRVLARTEDDAGIPSRMERSQIKTDPLVESSFKMIIDGMSSLYPVARELAGYLTVELSGKNVAPRKIKIDLMTLPEKLEITQLSISKYEEKYGKYELNDVSANEPVEILVVKNKSKQKVIFQYPCMIDGDLSTSDLTVDLYGNDPKHTIFGLPFYLAEQQESIITDKGSKCETHLSSEEEKLINVFAPSRDIQKFISEVNSKSEKFNNYLIFPQGSTTGSLRYEWSEEIGEGDLRRTLLWIIDTETVHNF